MPLLNVTTIALVAALANPLCCCLSLGNPVVESIPQTASAHACCHFESQDARADTHQPKQTECPHTDTQQMKISSQGNDLQLGLSDPLNLSSNFYEYLKADIALPYPLRNASPHTYLANGANAPPGTAKAKAYCVYLL